MYDVICIGGGLAGLTAAIHLKKEGHSVLVLEKEKYPHHKVCGEYLSKEVLPYLSFLGLQLPTDIEIDTLRFSTRKGRSLQTELPLGAIGISRYALDFTLYQHALKLGVDFHFCTVTSVNFREDQFMVYSNTAGDFQAQYVIGSYGKRSNIDKGLNREFIKKKSPWLGIKAHYHLPDFPDEQVGLHSFSGGYAGLSKTETGAVNFCYLVSYNSFQKYQDIDLFNKEVVAQNPVLAEFFERSTPIFDKPMSIAQISFESKPSVDNHLLMCGDTAGLIHPLCGNGMAMAIHSAKLASELIHKALTNGSIERIQLEKEYSDVWRKNFDRRIRMGRLLQRLLLSEGVTNLLFSLASRSPYLVKRMVRQTHGKPISL
ncbi:MAG: NAD(P)/FAD-dependent oxidoreductase [Flavobacteriaceae bacterium]|nr:NAD(P)/FAD-dependent oxidoreductase [Muriicola sp.]NNL38633.1 NAD(P)/FAD-dependent oxidoreductase [Flavobacteriaceae bacterium]